MKSLKLDDIKDTVDNAYRSTDPVAEELSNDDYIPIIDADGNKKKIPWATINSKISIDPIIPIDPATAPTENGAIWITTT